MLRCNLHQNNFSDIFKLQDDAHVFLHKYNMYIDEYCKSILEFLDTF